MTSSLSLLFGVTDSSNDKRTSGEDANTVRAVGGFRLPECTSRSSMLVHISFESWWDSTAEVSEKKGIQT